MKLRSEPAWKPTPVHEMLLDAAFAENGKAAASWKGWLEHADLDHMDRSSRRLLPLTAARIARLPGMTIPARILGLRRKTWFQNQVLIHRALPLMRAFQSHGIEILVIKGLAFTELYHKDRSLRPMEDIDIMVPPDRVQAAIEILKAKNWRAKLPISCPLNACFRFTHHAWAFQLPPTGQIDLHWRPLRNGCTQDKFMFHPIPLVIDKVTLSTLDDENHLLQICEHAIRQSRIRQYRWVADILILLGDRGHLIDWSRFLDQAGRAELKHAVWDLLGYVTKRFHAPVPASVLDELSSHTPTRRETTWYKLASCGRTIEWPLVLLVQQRRMNNCFSDSYLRETSRIKLLLDFLRVRLMVNRYWKIPFHIIIKVAYKLVRAVRNGFLFFIPR